MCFWKQSKQARVINYMKEKLNNFREAVFSNIYQIGENLPALPNLPEVPKFLESNKSEESKNVENIPLRNPILDGKEKYKLSEVKKTIANLSLQEDYPNSKNN